jgi:hypothetical protein
MPSERGFEDVGDMTGVFLSVVEIMLRDHREIENNNGLSIEPREGRLGVKRDMPASVESAISV